MHVGDDVVCREVRIDFGRVPKLELTARVGHHVAYAVDVWVAGYLQVVVHCDRFAEAEAAEEDRRVLEHACVGHHAHALVDHVCLHDLARLEDQRLRADLLDRLVEHQLGAARSEPFLGVGGPARRTSAMGGAAQRERDARGRWLGWGVGASTRLHIRLSQKRWSPFQSSVTHAASSKPGRIAGAMSTNVTALSGYAVRISPASCAGPRRERAMRGCECEW